MLAAISLLTRIPIGPGIWDRETLVRSVAWLPLIGGVVGLALGAVYAGLVSVSPPLLAAALTVTMGVLLTGALHEDGLADTADALGGGIGREEALRIMRDPTHGSYGVISLALSLVLRIAAIANLTAASALAVLPAAHALSRGGAVALMAVMRPAADVGLGAAHSHPHLPRWATAGGLVALLVGLATVGWWTFPLILVGAVGVVTVGVLAARRIGGFTGDVLGAAQQVDEVLLLALGALLVSNDAMTGLWWRG